MNDALNAEISLGTVSSINDAVQWLGYTYLFVRIKKNPMAYGTTLSDRSKISSDPVQDCFGTTLRMIQGLESSGINLL